MKQTVASWQVPTSLNHVWKFEFRRSKD